MKIKKKLTKIELTGATFNDLCFDIGLKYGKMTFNAT